MGITRVSIAGLMIVLLAGCKMHTNAEIYLRDVQDVAAGGDAINTPAEIRIEMSSSSKCEESVDRVSQMMSRYLPAFDPKRCIRDGMDNFLVAEAKLPLYRVEGTAEQSPDPGALFGIGITTDPQGPYRNAVFFRINRGLYSDLNAQMKDEFHGEIDLDESIIEATINNDTRDPVELATLFQYVNGTASRHAQLTLSPRDRLELRLPDIRRSLLADTGYALIFAIPSEPPGDE